MNKHEKRRIKREIAAIASLKDSEINTSDIPEITDWSGAVIGKFYRRKLGRNSQLGNRESKALDRNEGNIKIDFPTTTAIGASVWESLTPTQLLTECFRGVVDAWAEFNRRWHGLITRVVLRTARGWGPTSADLIEDLVQETYIKLFADQCKVLKEFVSTNTDEFAAFLKVVVANAAHDYFRSTHMAAQSSPVELGSAMTGPEASTGQENDMNILFEELDEILSTRVSKKERSIFWLWYRRGFTAVEISAIPTVGLTARGVQSVIYRLTKLLKERVSSETEKRIFRND